MTFPLTNAVMSSVGEPNSYYEDSFTDIPTEMIKDNVLAPIDFPGHEQVFLVLRGNVSVADKTLVWDAHHCKWTKTLCDRKYYYHIRGSVIKFLP